MHTIFDLEDLERLQARGGAERGAIFACLHYGGFEWIALVLGLERIQVHGRHAGFQEPAAERARSTELREVSGHQTIRREGRDAAAYTKRCESGAASTLAVDLTVSAKLPSVPINCFGMETCVTFAHAWLHKRTGAPIIPTHCEPLPGGRYRLVLHPALADCRRTRQISRSRRPAGIPSSRSCGAIPRRGCGCISTGVIGRRTRAQPYPGLRERIAAFPQAARAHGEGEKRRACGAALSRPQALSRLTKRSR